jgi:hypothetical protein
LHILGEIKGAGATENIAGQNGERRIYGNNVHSRTYKYQASDNAIIMEESIKHI